MAYDLCIRDEATGKNLPLIHYNDAGEKEYIYQKTLDKIKTIGAHGMQNRMSYCTALMQNIYFPQLIAVGDYGLDRTFSYCTGLTGSVLFPQLKSVGKSGLYYTFYGCKNIKEIHFRKDAQAVIQALDTYNTKFGATNATIYFDL